MADRKYIILSEAWYGPANMGHVYTSRYADEVTFGLYPEGGGTDGEMVMRWHKFNATPTPRLEVFDDAWKVLASFEGLIPALAEVDNKSISVKDFCRILDGLGFEDATDRVNPYGESKPTRCECCNQIIR